MPFSSTQPSLRARLLPRFPARVIAGTGMSITKSGGTYTFAVTPFIGGPDGSVQFNDVGLFGADSTFTFDKNTNVLTVAAITVNGNITANGLIESASTIKTTPTTVALLSAAGVAGRRHFVTDASATTFASVVAGGGANKVPVYDDGTNWRIG